MSEYILLHACMYIMALSITASMLHRGWHTVAINVLQLVWAESFVVGCSAVYCDEIADSDLKDAGTFFVCNYGPG